MKWKKGPPKEGDERERRRFAWKPTTLDDGYTVWLERYALVERYVRAHGDQRLACDGWWIPVRTVSLVVLL